MKKRDRQKLVDRILREILEGPKDPDDEKWMPPSMSMPEIEEPTSGKFTRWRAEYLIREVYRGQTIGLTVQAAGITDRTLRSWRKKGRAKRKTKDEMGIYPFDEFQVRFDLADAAGIRKIYDAVIATRSAPQLWKILALRRPKIFGEKPGDFDGGAVRIYLPEPKERDG